MKTRIISAILLGMILIPCLIVGGLAFDIAVSLIAMLALREFLSIKEEKKLLPNFIKVVCYIIMIFIIFGITNFSDNKFLIDSRIISGLFLMLLTPTILYHDQKIYSINDAFYLIGGVLFLGTAFSSLLILRHQSLNLLIYLLLITTLTDTYAYFGGYYIGKHYLIKEISPKKTWEGTIVGTLFAVFAASIFYHSVINPSASMLTIIGITLFLSIIGQFGDLIFSSIKRYFGKKDFSNLIPGHGGVLDRFDSIIFVILGYMFVFSLI